MNIESMPQEMTSEQRQGLENALESLEGSTAIPGRTSAQLLRNQVASLEWSRVRDLIDDALREADETTTATLLVLRDALAKIAPEQQIQVMHEHEFRRWISEQRRTGDTSQPAELCQELLTHTWLPLFLQGATNGDALSTRLSVGRNKRLRLPGLYGYLQGRLPAEGSTVSLRIETDRVSILDGRVTLGRAELEQWAAGERSISPHVGKGIDIGFDSCLAGTDIRLYSDLGVTGSQTRQMNLLSEASVVMKETWPALYGAFLCLTDSIQFLDDPLLTVVSDKLEPGLMQLGTFAHDPLVAATGLSHEVAHLFLYERTRLGQIEDLSDARIFSPWKQRERPTYLTLHALTTYLTQSVFLARYSLHEGVFLPYVTATLQREIERLKLGAHAFAKAEGGSMTPQTRSILEAVESFTDLAEPACRS